MNDIPLWAQILIALGGGALGGVTGLISSNIANHQKIKELQITFDQKLQEANLTYRQKLDENALAKASLYTETLYKPINESLSKLRSEYAGFKSQIGSLDHQSEEFRQACEEFRQACKEYVTCIEELFNQGIDVYLLEKLEKPLLSFTDFVKNSINATKHSLLFKYGIGKVKFDVASQKEMDRLQEARWTMWNQLRDTAFELQMGFFRSQLVFVLLNRVSILKLFPTPYYEGEIILAAPISSNAFEHRMSDIDELRLIIKDVILSAPLPTIGTP